MPSIRPYTLMDGYAVRKPTSSTNASPIVVTFAGHGLETGDEITVNGHATNTAANGTWTVTRVTVNTFSLDGSTGNGIGGNTGCFAKTVTPVRVQDYNSMVFSFDTDGGGDAAATIKVWGSTMEQPPDPGAAQAADNRYDFIDLIDQQNGDNIDGDTGFVVAAADDHVSYEANITGTRWMGVLPTAGTEGEFTVTLTLFNQPLN